MPELKQRSATLVAGPVGPTLISLAVPMAVGMAAIFMFQTVDTFFVGQLGVLPLAAMSFTFPVTFILISITVGIGMGATAVIGRAIGRGDTAEVRRLTTDSLLLAVAIVTVLAGVGLLTITPIFEAMGASGEALELIREYMRPWYLGIGFLVIPMVGNSAMRASGDTKTPMTIMLVSGLVNLALDPFLIFGWGPFPRLELAGAAIATVVSWNVTFFAALWVLHFKKRMLEFSAVSPKLVVASWRRVLRIGVPAALSNTLHPLSAAALTAIMARFGPDAVAAFGVGTRIEMLSTVGVHALGVAMMPFVAQNFGAKNLTRIRQALAFSTRAGLLWGLGAAALLGAFARPLATLFTDSPAVIATAALYLRTVPLCYGFVASVMVSSAMFNALNAPLGAAGLVALRSFGLALPLAYLGGRYGLFDAFLGLAAGNAAAGVVSFVVATRYLQNDSFAQSLAPPPQLR